MKKHRNVFDKIYLGIDLPSESVPGVPLVEMIGDSRLIVENHKGVTHYDHKEICINVSYGKLRICGCGLSLAKMSKRQLVIVGRIDEISALHGRC